MRNKVLINHIIFKSKRKKEKLLSVNQNHNSVDETHFTIFFFYFCVQELLPIRGNFTTAGKFCMLRLIQSIVLSCRMSSLLGHSAIKSTSVYKHVYFG